MTDKVERAYQAKGGNIFLDMGGAPPHENFTIFIPADAAPKFPEFQKYAGATVTVTARSAHTVTSPRFQSPRPTK